MKQRRIGDAIAQKFAIASGFERTVGGSIVFKDASDPHEGYDASSALRKFAKKVEDYTIEKSETSTLKDLQKLSDVILVFTTRMDQVMKIEDAFRRGQEMAKLINWLDQQNDSIRFHKLGIDFRKDNKNQAAKEAQERLKNS